MSGTKLRKAPAKGTLVITIVDCTPREARALLGDVWHMLRSNEFLGGSINVGGKGRIRSKVDVAFTPKSASQRRRPALRLPPFKIQPAGLER